MRARYSAFALQNEAFVLASWHPDHRPAELHLDDGTRYTGLQIHEATADEVEFTVSLKLPDGRPHRFRERSRFAKLAGQWVYLDGDVQTGKR